MIYLKTAVGIELRGEDLLISALQSNFSGAVFNHFKRFADYRSRDKEELRQEIASFFKSSGLSKENIVLGIPRRDLILRYLDLPGEVLDDLKQVIHYQVQSFEPTEEDRFCYDYALLNRGGDGKRLSVLLVMIRRSLLDEHLQILNALGIRPTLVTGSSMALSNLFLRSRSDLQDKTYVLVDLSPSSMELIVLRRGAFAYSRPVPKQAGQSWAELMLQELNEATSKLRLEPEETLEKIVLTGEAAESAHAELAAVLQDCELIRNAVDLKIAGPHRPRVQEAANCIGLAYTGMVRRAPIRINLLPQELRTHQTRWAYVPAAILTLAILILAIVLACHRTFQNQALVRKLDREIEALKQPVQKVQSLRSEAEELEKRIRILEDRLCNRDMNLEILRELTNLLPPDTYLMTYTYREGVIQMAGVSASAPNLISLLEKSPLLKDVTQRGGIIKDAQTGKDRFSFEAKLER